jgi:hypothetical protein
MCCGESLVKLCYDLEFYIQHTFYLYFQYSCRHIMEMHILFGPV